MKWNSDPWRSIRPFLSGSEIKKREALFMVLS
jgi:hypothetical protein